jgi:GDPmannose 4,6-dehydratase
MWLMLQQDEPGDYVVGTGETHSVKEFVEAVFTAVDLDWQQYVVIDPQFFRPAEVDYLRADPSKARRILRWEPTVSFAELGQIMVEADLKRLHETPFIERKE